MATPSSTPAPFPANLLLIGFMGTGKSSVGRLLAKRLGYRFADTDALVVKAAGMPITEIFARDGEARFREYESEALAGLRGRRSLVIATGGGIVERPENHPLLREIGLPVGLSASEAVIFERVSRNKRRPLLQTPDPRGTIAALLERRRPLYAAAADFEVDTSALTHEEVAGAILARLGAGA